MSLDYCPHCKGKLRKAAKDAEGIWECSECDRVWFILHTSRRNGRPKNTLSSTWGPVEVTE